MRAIRRAIAPGGLGNMIAADQLVHDAYGPGKAWFSDPRQSGGGCVSDLGVHLVDLALWAELQRTLAPEAALERIEEAGEAG